MTDIRRSRTGFYRRLETHVTNVRFFGYQKWISGRKSKVHANWRWLIKTSVLKKLAVSSFVMSWWPLGRYVTTVQAYFAWQKAWRNRHQWRSLTFLRIGLQVKFVHRVQTFRTATRQSTPMFYILRILKHILSPFPTFVCSAIWDAGQRQTEPAVQ